MIIITRRHLRFLSVALFFISLFLTTSFTQAQEDDYDVSTVSIHDTEYTRTGSIFEIDFQITNDEAVQPGVRYGVLLRQHTEGGQITADEYAEAETITLGPKESLARHITYAAPKVLDGLFTLYVVAKNSDGFTLATTKVADAAMNREETIGAHINIASCYLTHAGDTSGTRYSLTDTPRIQSGDVLTSHCMVENVSGATLEIFPRTTTYRRSVFGETVTAPLAEEDSIVLNVGESREIATALPAAGDPQTYVTALAYGYESNSVMYRYTVEGGSGAIQNVRLDKDGYARGDTALVSLDWIGSRELAGPQALISFSTRSGSSCGDPLMYPLIGSMHHDITVPITEDCPEPDVTLRLSDSSVGILGEYLYAIDKTPGGAQQEVPEVAEQGIFNNAMLLVFGFAVVVFGALIIAFFSRRKKEAPMVPPTVGPIAFFLAFSILSFFHAGSAEALSVNVNAPTPIATRFVEFHVSLDKSAYTPGEAITVTGSAELISEENCGDMGAPAGCNSNRSISLTVGGAEIFSDDLGWGSLTGNATLQAASSPGTHTLTVTARNQSVVKNRTIEYTVTAGGQAPNAPPASGGTSNGGSSSGAYSITATDIACNENDSFHRSKAKINWTTDASGGVLYNGASFAGAHAPGGFAWTTAQVGNVEVGWLAPNSIHTFTLVVNGQTKAEVEVEAGSCGGGGQNPGPGTGTNPPGGTGAFSITANPCTIPLGGSTCSIPGTGGAGITISGGSPSAAIFVRANTGNEAPRLYGFNSGSISADWVRPHLVFDVYEGASQQSGTWVPTGTRLGSVTDVAKCAAGSVWNADAIRCVAAPPAQGVSYISTCRQQSPVIDSNPQGDPGCPSVSGSDYDGVDFGWNYTGKNVTAAVLHGRTLSFSVSGLQPGAKMCKVFMVHPDGWQVPSPIAYAHQFCTYESNYSDISVSNGVAEIDIANVNPEYKVDAQYYLFFKNPGADKAVRMSVSVTPFGNGNAQMPQSTNYCSSLGSDITLYLRGYGVRTLDTEIPLSMNPYPEISNARARWNVSAVEFNAAPGDTVTFSRTSGQFDGDGSTSNPNNRFTMTVRGTPRTVGVHVTATTDQAICGGARNFSVFEIDNIHYAGVGQSHACAGAIPAHGSPWNGGEGTTNAPNVPWRFSQYDTGLRCEFKCADGYMWSESQSACVVNTAGTGGPDAWKWRVRSIPSPDWTPPPSCSADMSGIQNNDSCIPAQEGTCDKNGLRYTCRDITTEYPYFLVGKVVDMNGTPVAGLNIAAGYTGPSPHLDYRVYGTTGSDGRYKMRIEGNALRGYLRIPNGAPFDLEEPTPGYIYWNGGQILRDQTAIEGNEKLVPVADMVIRQIQTATAANGKSVVIANSPDLMSLELLVPATGIKGSTLSIAAQVLNNTTTATPSGFENTFSYRWGTNTTWQDLTPISKNALPSGETSEDALSFQLPAAGELWIKHCVNTSSAFTELSTSNNCVENAQPIVIADPASGLQWKKIVDLIEDEYTGALPPRCLEAPVVNTACSAAMPSPCHIGDFIYQCE